MSQIASSSGVRVAAQPLSNVYTVLLLLGAVALVATLVMLGVTMNGRYKCVLGVTEEGSQAKKEPEVQKARQDSVWGELKQTDKAISEFPEGVAAPAVGDETTPPAPAETTPPAPAETTPPAPAETTPPAPAETTPPAPAATTPPAPAETTPPAGGAATPPAEGTAAPAPEGGATPPAPPPAGAPAAN